MSVGYSKGIFWTVSKAVCVYAARARVPYCIWHLCVQSILASDRGALWDGRSLHPLSRASRGGRVCLGLPTAQTHCWCLQSAKQNKGETQRHGEGEILHSQREQYGWCIEGVGVCTCVFGRLQGLGSVRVCIIGAKVD